MRGAEQLRRTARDVVGVGAYQRELGRRRDRFNAIAAGIGQVMAPCVVRCREIIVEPSRRLPREGVFGKVVDFSFLVDVGVDALLVALVSAGKAAEAVVLKTAYNAGANVVYDAMEARARRSSSAAQT